MGTDETQILESEYLCQSVFMCGLILFLFLAAIGRTQRQCRRLFHGAAWRWLFLFRARLENFRRLLRSDVPTSSLRHCCRESNSPSHEAGARAKQVVWSPRWNHSRLRSK